jgi:hypothetical protein
MSWMIHLTRVIKATAGAHPIRLRELRRHQLDRMTELDWRILCIEPEGEP